MAYRTRLTLRFGDLDPAGIVYYPRYLHFCHIAMEEYFREALGRPYPEVLAEDDFGLPAVKLEVEFARPFRYGDAMEIEVRVLAIGETSMTWGYDLYAAGEPEPRTRARVVTVGLIMSRFEKRRIPDWIRERVPLTAT
ncbi:MAG TPA: thioesterase family protein [Thermoanaerobaculia bacterium]|nr:thioesterase family protein [Thermoanaerobaculia bacterium]